MWGVVAKWQGLVPTVQRVAGSNLNLAATYGPWASPTLTIACSASVC